MCCTAGWRQRRRPHRRTHVYPSVCGGNQSGSQYGHWFRREGGGNCLFPFSVEMCTNYSWFDMFRVEIGTAWILIQIGESTPSAITVICLPVSIIHWYLHYNICFQIVIKIISYLGIDLSDSQWMRTADCVANAKIVVVYVIRHLANRGKPLNSLRNVEMGTGCRGYHSLRWCLHTTTIWPCHFSVTSSEWKIHLSLIDINVYSCIYVILYNKSMHLN